MIETTTTNHPEIPDTSATTVATPCFCEIKDHPIRPACSMCVPGTENSFLQSLLTFANLCPSERLDAFLVGVLWSLWHNKQISRETAMRYLQCIDPDNLFEPENEPDRSVLTQSPILERVLGETATMIDNRRKHLVLAFVELFDPLETETMLANKMIHELHDPESSRIFLQIDNLMHYYAGSKPTVIHKQEKKDATIVASN